MHRPNPPDSHITPLCPSPARRPPPTPARRSMMIRGESFRSDFRVPTHMVHCMTNAQSIDRLVQSTGRATFLGKEFLAKNGFGSVQVLMTDVDFRTVKAYIKLSNTIKERLQEGKTLEQCFSGARRGYWQLTGITLDATKSGSGQGTLARFLAMPLHSELCPPLIPFHLRGCFLSIRMSAPCPSLSSGPAV